MANIITDEDAKKISDLLESKNIDFESGFDKDGLLHILCAESDEDKILRHIDSLKLPYTEYMWFGSFGSDAIVS